MSGGHFNYDQYKISQIADSIYEEIQRAKSSAEDGYEPRYSSETIAQFRKGMIMLEIAQIYAQRIDWLISGDDGEEQFHKRLEDDLSKLPRDPDSGG